MNFLKRHADLIIILVALLASTIWANGRFNAIGESFNAIEERFNSLENALIRIEKCLGVE